MRTVKEWLSDFFFPERAPDEACFSQEVVDDICVLARGAYPKEFVAFLQGKIVKRGERRVALVDGLSVIKYVANERSTAFDLHDLPLLHGSVGTVHSHPAPDPRPSAADRRLFERFGWCHVIIGTPYTARSFVCYDMKGRPFPWSVTGSSLGDGRKPL